MQQQVSESFDHETRIQYTLVGNLLSMSPVSRCSGMGDLSNLSTRTAVSKFSTGSSYRMQRYLRSCVAEYTSLVTLTYPDGYGLDGRQCKRDLEVFGKRLLRYMSVSFSAFWFMEFTEQGRLHFHLFINQWVSKTWLSAAWYQVVGSGDKKHLDAGTNVKAIKHGRSGTIGYARKYALKQEQKTIPEDFLNAGRFWGIIGMRDTVTAATSVSPLARESELVRELESELNSLIFDLIGREVLDDVSIEPNVTVRYLITDETFTPDIISLIEELGEAVVLAHSDLSTRKLGESVIYPKPQGVFHVEPIEVESILYRNRLTGSGLPMAWPILGVERKELNAYLLKGE